MPRACNVTHHTIGSRRDNTFQWKCKMNCGGASNLALRLWFLCVIGNPQIMSSRFEVTSKKYLSMGNNHTWAFSNKTIAFNEKNDQRHFSIKTIELKVERWSEVKVHGVKNSGIPKIDAESIEKYDWRRRKIKTESLLSMFKRRNKENIVNFRQWSASSLQRKTK